MTNGKSTLKNSPSAQSGRLMSLDVFRGMTVAFMIIVNNPGSWGHIYAPLEHSPWHGCTPTDLVFPSFLFIAGVAMYYSLKKYNFEFSPDALFRILRRVLLIFATGTFLTIFPYFIHRDYNNLRILGVLQRIALAYGMGAIIILLVREKFVWVATSVILLGYWAIMYFFGGADPYSLKDNFALIVDKAILGETHLYKGFGIPFDPEGLLSTLPATGTVLLGFMVGRLINKNGKAWKTPILLAVAGAVLVAVGAIWGLAFPINKPLWTSSYVLYAGGIAMIILSAVFIIVDIWGKKGWTGFFMVFGMNALFTFFLAGITAKELGYNYIGTGDDKISYGGWIYKHICCNVFTEPRMASLMFALMMLTFIWLIGLVLYKKKIFIKL
jgi:predicted acyltransferase